MISSNRISSSTTPEHSSPVESPRVTPPELVSSSAQIQGDSDLAVLLGQAFGGAKSLNELLYVTGIPPASSFGQTWTHFSNAMQNPRFVEWANREGIDLSKNIEINYRQNRISAVVGSTRHTFSSANIGSVWTSIMDPIMSAAKALRSSAPYVYSPFSTDFAPSHLVADFYGERSFPTLEHMWVRGRELLGTKTFGPVPVPKRPDGENPADSYPTPDEIRAKADSALAERYGHMSLQTNGEPRHDRGLIVSNIPPNSTFGEWWSQLVRAFQSPQITQWMSDNKVDKSTLTFIPGSNQISFMTLQSLTERPTLKTYGPQDREWSSISGPVVAAGQVVAQGDTFTSFNPLLFTRNDSAPLWQIKNFYKEQDQSLTETHLRANQILANKAFDKLDKSDIEEREDELATQRAILGNLHDSHNLGNQLQFLADQQVADGEWNEKISEYLKTTLSTAHPGSLAAEEPGRSLMDVIQDNGWDIPTDREKLENLSRYLLRVEPTAPKHGSYGGALAWPIPLSTSHHDLLQATVYRGTVGDIDLRHFKTPLEYVMHGQTFTESERNNPRELIDTLIKSPRGQALGKAIQAKFEALSVKGSVEDWLLAALNMDGYSKSASATADYGQNMTIAGSDLIGKDTWGKTAPEIVKKITDEILRDGDATSREGASALVYLLLSNRAPAYLVKDIPDTVIPGSHSWVSFVTAVNRIEARTRGATADMTYGQIMGFADVAPISLEQRQDEYDGQKDALVHWGFINGVSIFKAHLSEDVRTAFNHQMSELKKASDAYSVELPEGKVIALENLRKSMSLLTTSQLEEKCITLAPVNNDFPGPYSILDLYMEGRLFNRPDPSYRLSTIAGGSNEPKVNQWVSSSSAIDMDYVLRKGAETPVFSKDFDRRFLPYADAVEQSLTTQVKYLISQLPLEDRNNFEYGEIEVVREMREKEAAKKSKEIWPADPGVVFVKTVRNGNVHIYEINYKIGKIFTHPNLKELRSDPDLFGEEGGIYTRKLLPFRTFFQPLLPSKVFPKGLADEDEYAGTNPFTPNSFGSERSSYIADAVLTDTGLPEVKKSIEGLTTFDTEQPFAKKLREFMLNMIPLRSAINNFIAGDIEEGVADLFMDVLGFVIGAGAAARGSKALASGASALAKGSRALRIIGRAAIGVLNPFDGIIDIGRGIGKLVKSVLRKGQKGFRILTKAADSYDLIKAGKRFDSSSLGTFKFNNEILEGPAIFQNGKWYNYNPITRQPYGAALNDFLPSARIDTESFKKWAGADGVASKVHDNIVTDWKKTINTHRRGPDKDAFELGYLSGNPQTIAGFSNKLKAADIMKLAANKSLTAEQAGMLLKRYDDIAYEFGRSGTARFIDNLEPRFGTVRPMPQVVYLSMTKQLSEGQCAALSRAMATAIAEGNEGILLKNMYTAAAYPTAPASREFIARLNRLQNKLEGETAFRAGMPTRELSFKEVAQELANSTASKSVMMDAPGHAMAAGVKIDGTQRSYYFYDPNHGIVDFQNAEDMANGLERLSRDKKMKPQYKTRSTDRSKLTFTVSDHDNAWQQKNGVFGPDFKKIYDTPIQPPRAAPLSHVELLQKAPDNQGLLCYEASMRVGQAEKTISADVFDAVKDSITLQGPTNYSPRYLELMGIKPDALKTTFNPADITESGLLNFKHANEGGQFGHTVYIQKTADDQLYLFNTNSPDLDVAMARAGNPPVVSGGMTVYHLGDGKDKGLQNFLDGINGQSGWQYAYTPASALDINVKSMTP